MQILDATSNSCLTMQEHGDGSGTIVQSTDISGALARNAALRCAGITKTVDGDNLYASIPLDLINSWSLIKYGVTWDILAKDDKKLDEFIAEHPHVRIGGN